MIFADLAKKRIDEYIATVAKLSEEEAKQREPEILEELQNKKYIKLNECENDLKKIYNLTINCDNPECKISFRELMTIEALAEKSDFLTIKINLVDEELKVTDIKISGCNDLALSLLKNFDDLTNLEMFFDRCNTLDISKLKKLKTLKANICEFKSLKGLSSHPSLEELDLKNIFGLNKFDFSNTARLKKIKIAECDFEVLTGLANHTSLQELELNELYNLKNLNIAGMKQLKKLTVCECESLDSICALSTPPSLQKLFLSYLPNLVRLELSNPEQIKDYDIISCPKISR